MPTKRSQELMDLKIGKASKPLIEKRRRARINQSLAQLKTLVIDPKTTENSRQAKLEKADILEMTVKHLRDIKKVQSTELVANTENTQKKFERGYSECLRQVELFLGSIMDPQSTNTEDNLKKRLKDHLWRSLQGFQNPDTETGDGQKEIVSYASASSNTPVYDFPLATQSYTKSPSSVSSYDEASVSNTIDLSFQPPKKRKRDPTEVYNCNASQSVIKSPLLEEKGNYYNATSFKAVASSDTARRPYSPFDDFNADMRVPEDPLFNISLDRSNEGQSSCSFYPTSAEKSPGVSNLRASPAENHHHQQETSHTLLSNSPTHPREELKQKPYTCDSDGLRNFVHQIPLMPRRLQNGEWALVLPGSLALTENEVQNPLSAFRFVLPSCAAEDHLGRRQGSVSSPLSSSVSDMSSEEYSSRSDGEVSVKFEYDGQNDTFQCMWRPW